MIKKVLETELEEYDYSSLEQDFADSLELNGDAVV